MKDKKRTSDEMVEELISMIKDASSGRKDHLDLDDLKRHFDLILLDKVHRAFLKKGNEKAFLKVFNLPAKRWEKISALIRHLKNLVYPPTSDIKDYENSLQYFVGDFGAFVDIKIAQFFKGDRAYLYIQFINPPLDCLRGDLLFFHSRGDVPNQEIQSFVNIIESLPPEYLRKVAFILAPFQEQEFRKLAEESPYKFVILSSENLKDVVLAENPQIALNTVITSQLDLLDIQPYRTHGSTPTTMFFGRKQEIDSILNSPSMSVAIYGGRQLGKTSLLRKLQEILSLEHSKKTVFLTCEGVQNNLHLGLEILKQLEVDTRSIQTIAEFEEKFRDYLRKSKEQLCIFIDEVDDLVDLDRKSGQKVFVSLRNIHNDFRDKCRFFFAGFKKLYSEFYRLYAPFRNFAEPYELKHLIKKEAKKLIEDPLCHRLGIDFQSKKKVTDKICEYTGSHPCFIQQYCRCLIERIANEERRIITEEDVEAVYQSESYRNLVIGNYSDNFREGEEKGDILPKLLICHIIFEEMDSFTENKLLASLKRAQVEVEPFLLRTELRKLTMTSVLERVGNIYRFTNSVYPKILRENENLDDILLQLMEEYNQIQKQEIPLPPLKESNEKFLLRRSVIDQMVADSEKSYAIVGGNGFGKTSLLKTMKELYEFDLSYRPIFLSASKMEESKELVGKILSEFGISENNPKYYLDMLDAWVADENQAGRRQTFLIDDVDSLIRKDWEGFQQVLKRFEDLSLTFGEGFRAFLTGGPELYSMIKEKLFPKTIELIHLKPLDERDAKKLLMHLLSSQGNSRLEDETLVDLILEVTGGNPKLMEIFIKLLLEGTEKSGIRERDLENVMDKKEFQQALLNVYEDSWDSFQKKLIQAVISSEKDRFTSSEIAETAGVEEKRLREEFSRLSLLGFLKRTGRFYRLSNSYYKECCRCRKKNKS